MNKSTIAKIVAGILKVNLAPLVLTLLCFTVSTLFSNHLRETVGAVSDRWLFVAATFCLDIVVEIGENWPLFMLPITSAICFIWIFERLDVFESSEFSNRNMFEYLSEETENRKSFHVFISFAISLIGLIVTLMPSM